MAHSGQEDWPNPLRGAFLRGINMCKAGFRFHFTPAFPGHTLEESGSKSALSLGTASVRSAGVFMQTLIFSGCLTGPFYTQHFVSGMVSL